MLELEDALARILSTMPTPAAETAALGEADGRVLSETIHSPLALPSFDNSSMDGYAVRAADVLSAKADAPVHLRLAGRLPAGQTFTGALESGSCIRVFTGSPLPRSADAVVMQEDTRVEPGRLDEVLVLDAVRPGENVRLLGEDIKAEATLAVAGDVLTPGAVSLLAAAGLARVRVGRVPVVGLLATGSELRELGQGLGPGQIYESNRVGISALVSRAGARPILFPLVADELADTRRALEEAFRECDIVVTSGGVSVGEMDFVKRAFEESGGELQFWKVAIKPGRPFVFGRRQEKFLFGLPGNPVSAHVTFLLLVRPALLRWQGATDVSLPSHPGVLAEALVNPGGRRHFMRVKVDRGGKVHSAGAQASHLLTSLASANGMVDVPSQTTLSQGATVPVLSW
ncbi:MAG TPA: gephyrin-like molybdotransferase Glp [Candidatus Acidoferrum sp.]|jgi:molybdopterin molybdotransferase|nr:gephyrin-like molybdotransferase Glp [Candidatus Acidoferrum sp.]